MKTFRCNNLMLFFACNRRKETNQERQQKTRKEKTRKQGRTKAKNRERERE